MSGREVALPANRAASALQLRIDGAPFSAIAEALEFKDAKEAQQAVERALASEYRSPDEIAQVRALQSKRIDRILYSLMRRATNPKDPDHLAYANRALAAIKQQTDLEGAAAPARVDITYNPTAQQLEQWANAVTAKMHGQIAEGEIIDVEFEEDERA
jgi:4-hydroxyphenylpyruvate dioxygenase-like putative hemolysin